MNYNMYNNHSNSHHDWNFMNYSNTNNNNSSGNHVNLSEPLQEPVAFEDFQFSLGLDPEFAMPIPLDIPPPPPPMSENDLFAVEPVPTPINNAVLDEQDHKAFSQFLDQFFVDPNMQIDTQFSMYEHQPPLMSLDNNHQHQQHPYQHHPQQQQQQHPQHHHPHHQDEYNRQTTILQSLDEQKRYFNSKIEEQPPHERPGAVFLQKSNSITAPYIKPIVRESSSSTITTKEDSPPTGSVNSSNNNANGGSGGAIRRGKPHKELLTEEEKRNNHIASEQKRRSMIRSGFKDLTEIVPTLKNINNSKSTVLFKAVDYIKYLEKRNRNLREKIKNLEVRVEVEGRMGVLGNRPASSTISNHHHHHPSLYSNTNTTTTYTTSSISNRRDDQLVPPPQEVNNSSTTATAALLQHKTQQKQLMELQEKLQLHQKMLAQQQQQQQRRMYEQPRWNNDKSPVVETKMEVDTSSNESLKATVSA